MTSLEYDIYNLPSAIMMEHKLSTEAIQTLNTYLDKELQDPNRKSLSGDLVGQIHQGEQLSMDFECDQLKDFRTMVENLGVAYLRHFVEQTGIQSTTTSQLHLWVSALLLGQKCQIR